MKHALQLFTAMVVCSSLFVAMFLSTSAAPSLEAGPQPHMPPGPHRELRLTPSDVSKPTSLSPLSPSTIPGWSRLVFQSFRDNNWEIYRANADGTGQTASQTTPVWTTRLV